MPLTRTYFNVYVDDPESTDGYAEHRVEIKGQDQLRAELEGRKLGVDHKVAIHQTYLWAWAACVRLGVYKGSFAEFRDVVIKVDDEDTAAGADEPATVDPTRQAAGDASP